MGFLHVLKTSVMKRDDESLQTYIDTKCHDKGSLDLEPGAKPGLSRWRLTLPSQVCSVGPRTANVKSEHSLMDAS